MALSKVVPPVITPDKNTNAKLNIGPLVLMSGFLTKKNRTLNRWKQRWWQLLDNGMLYYYNSDDRLKRLGQIDIAHSCYDVKLGSENCRVTFPRVAPSCCCLSFTVLKRSYYLYAPTAAEAKKWAETLNNESRVLNRRVVAGVERRKAPAPPGPPRPPSCPPNMRINRNSVRRETFSVSESLDDSLEMSLQPTRTVPRFVGAKMKMASSVPDYLDRVGYSPPPTVTQNPNDRLWLDGSPYPVTTSTFGQTFPSPSASYTDEIAGSNGSQLELSDSLSSSSTSAHSTTRNTGYFQIEQGTTTFQRRRNSKQGNTLHYGRSLSFAGEQKGNTGRKIPSRHMLKNRCSLPIIFERDHVNKLSAKAVQCNRPASCVPNPLSSSTANSIHQTKSKVLSVTKVPVFPKVILANSQKVQFNRELAQNKQTQPQPLPRNRARAQSISNHLDNDSKAFRPVPKPRRSKGGLIDHNQPPRLERAKSYDFIATTNDHYEPLSTVDAVARILQAVSPTESERSVSVTTSKIVSSPSSTTKSSALPRRKAPPPPLINGGHSPAPPRPKRDSGPPPFVPTPPPIDECDRSMGTPSTCSS